MPWNLLIMHDTFRKTLSFFHMCKKIRDAITEVEEDSLLHSTSVVVQFSENVLWIRFLVKKFQNNTEK